MSNHYDYIIIGAGSAGCALAHELSRQHDGHIAVLEAGQSNKALEVSIPLGLVRMMAGTRRNWSLQSTPQTNLAGRRLSIPRGKMIGGSSSINSMVWFRGHQADFNDWQLPGWSWSDVKPVFERVEARIQPRPLEQAHPMSRQFASVLQQGGEHKLTPERTSSGLFSVNMRSARRFSAADAFLDPARQSGRVDVLTDSLVDRIVFENKVARAVALADGRLLTARGGIVLSAGAIMSPAILMRSGVGPASHLQQLGIELVHASEGVGSNLHDHPSIGVHHAGGHSGYGITLRQLPQWLLAPFSYAVNRRGPFASNVVEAGAFFRAEDETGPPDIQVHFLPFMMGWKSRRLTAGSGYFADVVVCRPKSRGRLTLASADARCAPEIDLGVCTDERDVALMVHALRRLRGMLAAAPFGERRAPEVCPGDAVHSDEQIVEYIRQRTGTAYHPVGTLAMGLTDRQPVAPDLSVKGVERLWVADASIMPAITSANTNAPCMMIGAKASQFLGTAPVSWG